MITPFFETEDYNNGIQNEQNKTPLLHYQKLAEIKANFL